MWCHSQGTTHPALVRNKPWNDLLMLLNHEINHLSSGLYIATKEYIPTFDMLACLACADLNDSDPSEK